MGKAQGIVNAAVALAAEYGLPALWERRSISREHALSYRMQSDRGSVRHKGRRVTKRGAWESKRRFATHISICLVHT